MKTTTKPIWAVLIVATLASVPAIATAGWAIPVVSGPPWLWVAETADSGNVHGWTSTGLDSMGRPHVAYLASGGTWLAIKAGNSWTLELVNIQGPSSLAIDSQDQTHLSQSAYPGDLNYTHQTGTSWTSEVVDSQGNVGDDNRLKLDTSDMPHIVYRDQTNNRLKYAYKDTTGWHNETIPGTLSTPFLSMDIDSAGQPHVAWIEATKPLQHTFRNMNGTWATTVVDASASNTYLGISVDSQDHIHISYNGAGETLKYANYNGATWTNETVDADSPTGGYASIDVDSQNRPHIAYWQVFNRGNINDPTRGHLKYATKLADGSWHTTTVDPVGITGTDTSIAIDKSDRPRISYYFAEYQPAFQPQLPRGDLKYAEPAGATLLAGT